MERTEAQMRIRTGTTAPTFRLSSIDGTELDLADLSGKPFLLSFFRFATCPFCNLRMHELVTRLRELDGALDIVAVFDSPIGHLREHAGRHRAPFPVLADPGGACYRAYGVERSLGGTVKGMFTRLPTLLRGLLVEGYLPLPIRGHPFTMPADFLIDRHGIVRTAYYGRDEGDHLPFDAIVAFADGEREDVPPLASVARPAGS
jgi:peroxiredoxin